MEDMQRYGGTPAVLKYLLDNGRIHGDCMTCTGKTMAENLENVKVLGEYALFPLPLPAAVTIVIPLAVLLLFSCFSLAVSCSCCCCSLALAVPLAVPVVCGRTGTSSGFICYY
jgi:hypothetical protein